MDVRKHLTPDFHMILHEDPCQQQKHSLQILWPGTEHLTETAFSVGLLQPADRAACVREIRRLVDFLNETRPSQRLTSRTCQLDPIGQPPHLWPYPHPATGFVLFGAGWSVCVCASFVLLLVVFFVMSWFGYVSLLRLVWVPSAKIALF